MKTLPIYLHILLLLNISLFFSCSKEYGEDTLYITGTEVNPVSNLSAEEGRISKIALSISSSAILDHDVTIEISTAPEKVAEYNKNSGQNYLPIPEGDYGLGEQELNTGRTVLKAGSAISEAIEFRVKSVKNFKEGSAYMMPVTISNVSGGNKVLEASRTIYYVVKPVTIQQVADLGANRNWFKPDFSTNNTNIKAMRAITYETRVSVKTFGAENSDPHTLMGIEEHYMLRFGNINIPGNELQRSGGVGGMHLNIPFATDKWYHVALTYDGTTEKIYIDGKQVEARATNMAIDLTNDVGGGFGIGAYGNGQRNLNAMFSETRVWSKALSQTEIQNGMCGVSPASPGLVGYWKFNEATERVVTDLSGNGHHATAGRNIIWVPGVRCE